MPPRCFPCLRGGLKGIPDPPFTGLVPGDPLFLLLGEDGGGKSARMGIWYPLLLSLGEDGGVSPGGWGLCIAAGEGGCGSPRGFIAAPPGGGWEGGGGQWEFAQGC
jgi:hypothetical protein